MRGVKKEHLPTKICVVCERPFNWRKKWEQCWDQVTTCSKSCNRKRRERARNQKSKVSHVEQQNTIESDSSCSNEISEDNVFEMIRSELRLEHQHDAETPSSSQKVNSFDGQSDANDGNKSDTSSSGATCNSISDDDPKAKAKAERKAAKKAKKAARRAQREGRGDPSAGQKPCDMCGKSVNLLIRCTYDASGEWKMVCGKCWNVASGGVVDGDAQHPHYRYGGLWKNRRAH